MNNCVLIGDFEDGLYVGEGDYDLLCDIEDYIDGENFDFDCEIGEDYFAGVRRALKGGRFVRYGPYFKIDDAYRTANALYSKYEAHGIVTVEFDFSLEEEA